ncbi:hypothetical protein MBRA1_002687 [Malassezia brasiliensis]|uniref:F-box domain-containing protein n=1 Tax=Malassezia brasiliensis TaxID=1821822 RepID=A0AAF0IQG1_9BASI|nr:hypothetical protein MBRA1_002687 [Malassezia brasiliensis]
MHAVPPEVLAAVLAWLDPWDLARACRVCRAWHAVCLDESVWAHAARDTPLDAALQSTVPLFVGAATLGDVQRRWHARRHAWGRTHPIPPALYPRRTVYRPPDAAAQTHVERVAIEYVSPSHSPSQGILIESTSANLRALDAATGAVLWATPPVEDDVLSRKHLGVSRGWLLQDEYMPTRAHLWRATRGHRSAARGQFAWHRSWAEPGRALVLAYPILAWYVRRSRSKKDDQYVETDVRTARVVRTYPLDNTLHEAYRVQALALDDDYVFAAGQWRDNVAILHRASGRAAWTLPGHIRAHGAPVCYCSETARPAERGAFARRSVVHTPAPVWVQTLPDWRPPRTPTYTWYEWKAIAVDRASHTLLFLGEDALLVVPAYAARLRGEAAPAPYLYLLPGGDAAPDKARGIAACDGRVAVLWRTLTLLDLQPRARAASDAAPLVVYDYAAPADDTFAGCDGIAMDATSIYAVVNDRCASADAPHAARRVAGFHFDAIAER